MGRWLRKIQELQADNTLSETSVSYVSTLTRANDKNSAPGAQADNRQISGVTPLLYRASDLMPDLNLIPGTNNDEGYIDRILANKGGRERHMLLSTYRQIWLDAINQRDERHAGDNEGRRAANRWLYYQATDPSECGPVTPSDKRDPL